MPLARKIINSAQGGRMIYKHIAILDLKGLGRKHMSSDYYDFIKAQLNIGKHRISFISCW